MARTSIAAAFAACALVFGDGPVMAAEIKVIASPGVRALLRELAPQFESTMGHKVVMEFDVIAVLKRRIEADEAFDIVIPGPELIDELIKQGKVAADTHAALGRTGIALAVRKGAPKPDISTPEALKRALLGAKAVGHSKQGQSGVHFREALNRLGIAQEMGPKLRAFEEGGQAVAIEKGEIDFAVGGTGPIMETPGTDFLGSLPPALQSYVKFSIGVSTASREPQAARVLVRFLTSPAVAPAFKSKQHRRSRAC